MDGADRALPSPFILTWSPLLVLLVSSLCGQGSTKSSYRLFSTCFPCEELNDIWGHPWLLSGEASVRSLSFSSLSAQYCCTQQGSTAAWHLASRQDGSSNKTCKYFVRDCGSSLWNTSGMLTTELYWHSVETVGKANWNHLEWGMVIISVVTVKMQWLNVNSKNMKIKVDN